MTEEQKIPESEQPVTEPGKATEEISERLEVTPETSAEARHKLAKGAVKHGFFTCTMENEFIDALATRFEEMARRLAVPADELIGEVFSLLMPKKDVIQEDSQSPWEEYFAGTSDTELQNEVLLLHDLIHNYKCYGTSDLDAYWAGIAEIERRGYKLYLFSTIKFSKDKSLEDIEAIGQILYGGKQ